VAQQTRIVDDFDLESDATVQLRVGLDGRWVALDLNDENAKIVRDTLAEYMGKGRPESKPRREIGPRGGAAVAVGDDWWVTPQGADAATKAQFKQLRDDIRDWAKENGEDIGSGRLPREVCNKYLKWLHSTGRTVPVLSAVGSK
jgi:hypothetical protein